jgi:hypothetical protein
LRFLSIVDIAKGPIKRRVDRLERRRDLDPVTYKMQEYLVAHVIWQAKDFNDNDIFCLDIKEGFYNYPKVHQEIVNRKRTIIYDMWEPRYDIPFSPAAVDEALKDSINPPELVNYFVRVSKTQRDGNYSHDQFRDSSWEDCVKITGENKGLNR